MDHPPAEKWRNRVKWVAARGEVLVPVLGLALFFMVAGWGNSPLATGTGLLVCGLAAIYAGLVLWSPMRLPDKDPRSMTRAELGRTAMLIALVVVGGAMLQMVFPLSPDQPSEGKSGLIGLFTLLLVVVLGTTGLAAERMLPVDLFPVFRQREVRRILYTLVAAFFLALLTILWGNLSGGLARGIGTALGETPPEQSAASLFDTAGPLRLLLYFLVGAGLFEEMLFRVGVMTPIWALTRRWGWGLLASALVFGLYHISPLSGMSNYYLQAPVIAMLSSISMGLANGVVYHYRGFTTIVLAHALGNWLVVMLLGM